MLVAALQLDIAWEDPRRSLAGAGALVAAAAAAGARLVALPELFATGFSMDAEKVVAATPLVADAVAGLARRHRVFILAGWAAPAGGRPLNVAVLVGPDGAERGRYAKIHPFGLAGEGRAYGAGDELVTLAVDDLRVTPLICYDLRFPELFRAAAEATDLFVVLANWPERRAPAWRTLLRARAIDGQAWLLGVNRVGEDGHGVAHRGDSSLVAPDGAVVGALAGEEGLVLGEVDGDTVRQHRARFGFLADRRPEVYRRLGHPEAAD